MTHKYEIGNEIVVITERMKLLIEHKEAEVIVYQDSEGEIYVELSNVRKTDNVLDNQLLKSYHTDTLAEQYGEQVANFFCIPLINKL